MEDLSLDEYQRHALSCRDCPDNPFYYALGLTGEAGEVADKLKKFWRDTYYTHTNDSPNDLDIATAHRLFTYPDLDAIRKELGDTLWYIAAIANSLGMKLSAVAEQNIDKCRRRVETGTLHGEGDYREEQKI